MELPSKKTEVDTIFICYAKEDSDSAKRLYYDLKNAGLTVWRDKDVLPGENWEIKIRKLIRNSRYFIPLFSSKWVGGSSVQKQIKYAIDNYDTYPVSEVYIIPVRLDDCQIPYLRLAEIQYVDLFPDWNEGFERLCRALGKSLPAYSVVERRSEDSIENVTDGKTIERYPYATFPSQVRVGKEELLEIGIKSKSTDDSRPIHPSIRPGDTEVLVDVIVYPGTFQVRGDRFNTIRVPVALEDSEPVPFFLTATTEGNQRLDVRFFQRGAPLGKLSFLTIVLPRSDWKLHTSAQLSVTADWKLPEIEEGPDLILYIIEDKRRVSYQIRLSSEKFPFKRVGPLEFKVDPEEQIRNILKDFEDKDREPDWIEDNIRSKGEALYDMLFPDALKTYYWDHKEDIKSIRVLSDEPWMPWEILKPYSPKGDNGSDFLCQKHSFSRLISDGENRIQKGRQFKKLAVVVPRDTRLVKAVEEQDWLKKFGRDHGIDVLTLSTFKEVKDTLRNDPPDIWHFTSHGKYNAQDPLSSAIKMEGRNELRVNFVRSTDMNFGKNNPVVFLNACQTGEQGMSLTGIQSWAIGFIGVGACTFIAPLWSVRDKTAYAFAIELYTELSNGESLGEAVRSARIKCKEIGDPSWLAYQLYGNPFDTINFRLATASAIP